jgi:hypothetical protein
MNCLVSWGAPAQHPTYITYAMVKHPTTARQHQANQDPPNLHTSRMASVFKLLSLGSLLQTTKKKAISRTLSSSFPDTPSVHPPTDVHVGIFDHLAQL